MPPTTFGEVGFSGGQDVASSQPLVTFFQSGGTSDQNNIFYVTYEGTPVTVIFVQDDGVTPIAIGGSADVPLGPLSDAGSILGQISAAMTTAGVSGVSQEGAGIRFRGTSPAASASIVIGAGSANKDLGFDDGDATYRTDVSVASVVSVLNSSGLWADGGGRGFAKTIKDDTGARYLYIQDTGGSGAGTTSSIAFDNAAADDALRPGTAWDSPQVTATSERLPLTATSLLRLIQRLDQVRPTPPSSTVVWGRTATSERPIGISSRD